MKLYLEDKFPHFSNFERTLFEAMEVVICQDEKSFLPPESIDNNHIDNTAVTFSQRGYLKLLSTNIQSQINLKEAD